MNEQFINLTHDTIDKEHLCCAISDKKHQTGVAIKKQWLKARIKEGHIFRKLNKKGKVPYFSENVKKMKINKNELTIYYSLQCPYIPDCIEQVKEYCTKNNIPLSLIAIDTLEKSKNIPCIFNNWAVFYNGKFETNHLLNKTFLKKKFLL